LFTSDEEYRQILYSLLLTHYSLYPEAMTITPLELIDEPLEIDESLPEGAMEYAPDLRQVGALHVKGVAELLLERRGPKDVVQDIRLKAHFDGHFEQLCARCLEPVAEALVGDFDLIYRPQFADAEAGERAITEDETEIGYYGESGLSLEDAVREQVVLTLPARTLCQDDCKGLCPHCGVNRNQSSCTCEEKPVDPRLAVLAGLQLPR
jgi:uncharacterized protein